VTLGAAALALLNPLQDRLEREAEQSLRTAVITARPQLDDALRASRGQLNGDVLDLALALYRRTGSRVILTNSTPTIDPYPYDTGAGPDNPRDIYRVLATNQTVTSTSPDGETHVATLLTLDPKTSRDDWVLAVRNPSDDVASIVAEVRSAFIRAAIIGLAVALLLGLALVGTLTARLERPAPRATSPATRSATSPGRSRRCRRRWTARSAPAGSSWRPRRTSCARR
jgi:hypothetical protein